MQRENDTEHKQRQVVISGLGCISPLGNTVAETWAGIVTGKSGIGKITIFDASEHKTQIAGEIKNFDAAAHIGKKEARRMSRFCQYALAAGKEALIDAGLPIPLSRELATRTGAMMGNSIGGIEALTDAMRRLEERGAAAVPPLTLPKAFASEVAGNMAISFGIQGPAMSVSTACASGSDAIGMAAMMIKSGLSDLMLAGGSEESIEPLMLAGFDKLQALCSSSNDDPTSACKPFDRQRDGFVMAEGAAILVLEEKEHAIKRGAHIYAELCGYGASNDAYHITSPDPSGSGAVAAMRAALEMAELEPKHISYINAHGTSTALNDAIETQAIMQLFGSHASKLAISSTKSMTGHLLGAAGALEAVLSIKALTDDFVPPTINLKNPDEACPLDYCPGQGRKQKLDYVLSNSFGFGGHNACLIFGKPN